MMCTNASYANEKDAQRNSIDKVTYTHILSLKVNFFQDSFLFILLSILSFFSLYPYFSGIFWLVWHHCHVQSTRNHVFFDFLPSSHYHE